MSENKTRKWNEDEIELIEEYSIEGTKRYRFHVKNSNIIIDIRAPNREAAWNKVFNMLERIRFKNPMKNL